MSSNQVTLRIAEAESRDVGRGIARIDPKIMRNLGLTTGDAIEVSGKKKTVALCWPGRPEDHASNVIRLDASLRANAGVRMDDKVTIKKIAVTPAERITLVPVEPLRLIGAEEYLAQLLEGRIVSRGDHLPISIMGRRIDLVVTSVQPNSNVGIVTSDTDITLAEQAPKESLRNVPKVSYEDMGGLHNEIQKIREMIELPLRHPELFERLGVEAPKGVLLHGPPGTGKTLLVKAVANETDAHFISLSGPEIMSKFYGESEERLRAIFKEAEENAPSIIFIDEIDSIAPKRDEVSGEVERRVVSQLLTLMNGLQSRGKVVVIGATNRPNAIDLALRRPGRFDREIEIGVPDTVARKEILQIHTRGMPLAETVNLEKIGDVTHGFVGADLEMLCKEAAMKSLRRILPKLDFDAQSVPAEILNKISVEMKDFEDALQEIEPSALREVLIEVPKVKWSDIGGLDEVKQELQESVQWPLKYKELFEYAKAKPPKGILLYGPPGTGKTLLAKAVANESEANFIGIKGPELLSKWVGESEKAVREVFRKAKQAAPAVVFIDEVDSITPTRGSGERDTHVTERIISQLLTEIDGVEELKNVVVIAATNRPDIVDPALMRPGRFDRLLYVPPPDLESRKKIFRIHLREAPLAENVGLDNLAAKTDGYTGADIAGVCNIATMLAMREFVANSNDIKRDMDFFKIHQQHFEQALKKSKSSVQSNVFPQESTANRTPITLTR